MNKGEHHNEDLKLDEYWPPISQRRLASQRFSPVSRGSLFAEPSLGQAQEMNTPVDKEVLSCDVEVNGAYRV